MKFGFLDNSRIFVMSRPRTFIEIVFDSVSNTVLIAIICKGIRLFKFRMWLSDIISGSVLGRTITEGGQPLFVLINSNFTTMFQTKNMKFANNAQGADNARTSPRKREIPSLSLKRQLKHLKAMIRTERNHKLRAYSFILDNSIFDCYSHYCMTTLPDSIPDEFIEIMDIMSLKTDPTLLKNDALWKS